METSEKYVLSVYNNRSFSLAAKELFISQPALSASISRHEKAIGFSVFDRSVIPVALTEKGKIYIAESPLFEITSGGETSFAYNEYEKTEILNKLGNKKYTIQRSKGLGENEPDMMWRTTMCPQTRRLIAVTPTDAEETAKMFDVLLGDALQDRKKFITDYGHLYIKDADI